MLHLPSLPPTIVLILVIVFIWRFLNTLDTIGRGPVCREPMLINQTDFSWLQPTITWGIAVSEVLVLWYLFWPESITPRICLISVGLSAVSCCLSLWRSLSYNQAQRQAMVANNLEARGLPPKPEAHINFAANPKVITLAHMLILVLHWQLILLVLHSQSYFDALTR